MNTRLSSVSPISPLRSVLELVDGPAGLTGLLDIRWLSTVADRTSKGVLVDNWPEVDRLTGRELKGEALNEKVDGTYRRVGASDGATGDVIKISLHQKLIEMTFIGRFPWHDSLREMQKTECGVRAPRAVSPQTRLVRTHLWLPKL